MAIVKRAQKANKTAKNIEPVREELFKPNFKTISHNTSDNSTKKNVN